MSLKISFCTACMNRLSYLMAALPLNIISNTQSADHPDLEFVVLNYSSSDAMDVWMNSDPEILAWREQGLIRYALYPDATNYHYSHAKNMSHRLATGDILCNLDADNFTGPDFANLLTAIFEKEPNTILRSSKSLNNKAGARDGSFGRIALSRENFFRLGGYTESGFSHWNGEDTNLLYRAVRLGLKHKPLRDSLSRRFCQHSDALRMAQVDRSLVDVVRERLGKASQLKSVWKQIRNLGVDLPANEDGAWGCGRVVLNHGRPSSEEIILGPSRIHEDLSNGALTRIRTLGTIAREFTPEIFPMRTVRF